MKKTLDFEGLFKTRINMFIVAIIVTKIVLMGAFSSDYQNELFIPFVTDFVVNGGNPYQRAYANGMLNSFPYPVVMLLVESIGTFFIQFLHLHNIFLTNILFKLPSLIVDFLGLCILNEFFPDRKRYAAIFYFGSPIVIYGVYMHGQLDLMPMVFLMYAIFFLVARCSYRKRYILGCIFSVASLLCKLHILAVLPIITLYLIKRDGLRSGIKYFLLVIAGTLLGFVPFWSDGFVNLVLFNTEQNILTKVSFDFYTVKLYIPVFAVLFVYILAYKTSYMNKELLFNLCGVVFAVFLAFCPPMPGWYVWIVPFVALFLASISEEKYKNVFVYFCLNVLYLVYFIFFHKRELVDLYFFDINLSFIKIDNDMVVNLLFTLLSGLLIYLFSTMYQLGVANNNFYKRKNLRFAIGIAGDSGAGKTSMIEIIEKGLGNTNIQYIEGDGDHKWERGNHNWDDYTALNPKANYLYRQSMELKALREGITIRRADYDHKTGKFMNMQRIRSKKYVILCGLHALYLPQTRTNLDLKIYMDSDEKLRRYWKIKRDTSIRGHSKEEVLKSIEARLPDAQRYIYPQKDYADLIVRYYDKNLIDYMKDSHDLVLSIILKFSAAVDIEPLVNELRYHGINVEYEYSDDLQNQIVTIDADNMLSVNIPLERVAAKVIPQLEELTKVDLDTVTDAKDGIIILFLLLIISNKMQGIM